MKSMVSGITTPRKMGEVQFCRDEPFCGKNIVARSPYECQDIVSGLESEG